MVYWLVALPLTSKRKEATWELLQERTSGLSSNFKLEVPELRVGTLDTLMALSDELSKTANVMEGVATKIRRQVYEFGGAAAVSGLKVEGLAVESYVQRFKWEEAKFPVRRPLKETVEKVTEVVGRIEDDMKASACAGPWQLSPGGVEDAAACLLSTCLRAQARVLLAAGLMLCLPHPCAGQAGGVQQPEEPGQHSLAQGCWQHSCAGCVDDGEAHAGGGL